MEVLVTQNRREFVYLGWQGFANFGDDLLHETWKAALNDPLDIEAPLFPKDYVKRAGSYIRHRRRLNGAESLVLLGGGTTVGFGNWAQHARTAVRAYGAEGIVIAGAGAASADDAYALELQKSDWELWRSVPGVVLFGVRGPLTQAESELNWRDPCSVIGDPALMYPVVTELTPTPLPKRSILGVCLGSQTSTRFDISVVAESIKQSAAMSGDLEVRVFQLANSDAEVAKRLSAELGDVPIIRYDGDVRHMMAQISDCAVFVSERLHGAVASVAVGVPTVPLAYASKCDDFWLSVSGARPKIGIGHSVEELTSEIMESQTQGQVAVVNKNRDHLVEQLLVSASAVRSWKAGTSSILELQQTAFSLNKATQMESLQRGPKQHGAEQLFDSKETADISVVVPYGSGLAELRAQIRCVLDQDFDGKTEVIVACNTSLIATAALVEQDVPDNVTLLVVDASAVRGPSFARNVGWQGASASKVVFCDADDEVDRHWLSAMSDALDKSDLVGGRLSYTKLNDPRHAAWHYQTTNCLPSKFRHLEFVPSCNLGAKRTVLEALGGFDTAVTLGEDIDLCWRAQYAGFILTFVPDAVVEYRLRTGLAQVWSQAFNYGASDAALLKMHAPFGARRTISDAAKEALATPWAGIAMLGRPWLVRKFVTRAGSLSGRITGSIRAKLNTF
jgi:GT2 family glycosyltransferase